MISIVAQPSALLAMGHIQYKIKLQKLLEIHTELRLSRSHDKMSQSHTKHVLINDQHWTERDKDHKVHFNCRQMDTLFDSEAKNAQTGVLCEV